jgi:DNA polymerase
MENLSIDIETYSPVDLTTSGVYKYCATQEFEILLLSYSVDNGPVVIVDIASGEKLPQEIEEAIKSPKVIKWAFNASFERICLSRYFMQWLSPDSWRCSMVWAGTLGMPMSLAGVGSIFNLKDQKLSEGKDLIRYFCQPCKPTKVNGGRTRNLPSDAPEKWALFKKYNIRDVEVELAIKKKMARFPVTEWDNYILDQNINDNGILLDKKLVEAALVVDETFREAALKEAKSITGLENPNSVSQLKDWLLGQGVVVKSLDKEGVSELLKTASGEVKKVLNLRLQLAKSSVKKYQAMKDVMCEDNRAHGLLQFYGANRTGRWAGRLVQVQNLPQNHMPDLKEARNLVIDKDFASLDCLYDSVPKVLSELIRTAFIPAEGQHFYVSDFSAIEARVIAWLAGEKWRLKVFEEGGDIYCASASRMFHVPVVKHGINGELRQKGKIAELALGYGGAVGALTAMGALTMGVKEEELQPLVDSWRDSNPKIVQFWWDVDKSAIEAVKEMKKVELGNLTFEYKSKMLFITLPSGRRLAYVRPKLEPNQFGKEAITYEGIGVGRKWMRIETYGPKLVENIVQATARDLLAEAMQRLTKAGYKIVMHVHDEVIIEGVADLNDITAIMGEPPKWAEGLKLNADGYVCDFYKKE